MKANRKIGFMIMIIFHIPGPRLRNFAAFQQPFYMFNLAYCICYRQDPAKNVIQE